MRPASSGTACGHLWQEAAPSGVGDTPVCHECGTFAVGRCPECGLAVCGVHSWLINDKRLCRAHAVAARKAIDDRRAAASRHQQDRVEAAAVSAKQRQERAEAELRRLIGSLNEAGRPGLAPRHRRWHEERYFSKKLREVIDPLEPGWPVGPLLWHWSYVVRGDDITGKRTVQSAALPNGKLAELNVGHSYESERGSLRLHPHTLQTERVNTALACHLRRTELPEWQEEPTKGSETLSIIVDLEHADKAADEVFLRAAEGSSGIIELTETAAQLDKARRAVEALLRTVEPTWLTDHQGDRIVRAQELASHTRARLESQLEGRTQRTPGQLG